MFRKIYLEQKSLDGIEQLDFTHALFFSIGVESYKTDFLTKVSGVSYQKADIAKILFPHEEMQISFINLNHLVLTKMGTGRGKDMVDIEKLKEVQAKINK